ncbi:MAG TPA: serine hydrolase domain-containing protein [Gammaproteobacteria bacterium]|nr:serine hydrolase domain-containing protein [Gammaproteobacteria bacterium]
MGNNASTYLNKKIWKPFGMGEGANWLLDSEDGSELGGCCISATLRDYARIGLFAMNDGVLADGTEVLPEGWMQESTEPSKGFGAYGYLWWLHGDGQYGTPGVYGQRIFIDPASNLIIAAQSNTPNIPTPYAAQAHLCLYQAYTDT